jgi:hypothetical protein
MSLVLPAPVNIPTDEVLSNGAPTEVPAEDGDSGLLESEKLKKNIIFPPPEIRSERPVLLIATLRGLC